MSNKGVISCDGYSVWCGICGNWEFLESGKLTNSILVKYALKKGWIKNSKNGWTCPKCQTA